MDATVLMLANSKKLKQGAALSSRKNELQIFEIFMAYEIVRKRWDEFIVFLMKNAGRIVQEFEAS